MPETKAELLARFPDNEHQLIGPDDIRALAVAVFEHGASIGATMGALPASLGQLRAMEFGVAFPLPLAPVPPPAPGVPPMPWAGGVNDLTSVGLSVGDLGFQAKDSFVVRWSPDTWVLIGRRWTGSPIEAPFMLMMVADAVLVDSTVLGVGTVKFHFLDQQLQDEIGPAAALGADSLVHHITALEQRIHVLEHTAGHAAPPVEYHLTGNPTLGGAYLMLVTDNDELFNESPHIVDLAWKDGHEPDVSKIGIVSVATVPGSKTPLVASIRLVGQRQVTAATVKHWIDSHSRVTLLYHASAPEHFTLVKVQQVGTVPVA